MAHPRRNLIWYTFQAILRCVLSVWLRYRASGYEHVDPSTGGLLLINHQSFMDPLLVGLPLNRPVAFVARDSLFRVPLLGGLMRKTYAIPIDRDAAGPSTIRAAAGRAQDGFLVGIFPEGTRSTTQDVGDFLPGFVAIVRRAKVPVYPVGIAGALDALPRHAFFPRPSKVRVVFGKPFSVDDVASMTRRGQESHFVEQARQRVVACQAEATARRHG